MTGDEVIDAPARPPPDRMISLGYQTAPQSTLGSAPRRRPGNGASPRRRAGTDPIQCRARQVNRAAPAAPAPVHPPRCRSGRWHAFKLARARQCVNGGSHAPPRPRPFASACIYSACPWITDQLSTLHSALSRARAACSRCASIPTAPAFGRYLLVLLAGWHVCARVLFCPPAFIPRLPA